MNPYITQLKKELANYESRCGDEEPFSVLELLWCCYSASNPVDDGRIRQSEAALAPVFEELSAQNADLLFDLISQLSLSYQRAAFLEGLQAGMRLTEELQ